jgi:hypothetical protein
MEASMSKRFESSIRHDTDGRVAQALREMPSASWEAQSERAVSEAERILDETEPSARRRHYVRATPPCGVRPCRFIECDVRLALAASLAAVLPVLDELAFEAGHPGNMPAFEPWAESIWRRNRATDASMAHA